MKKTELLDKKVNAAGLGRAVDRLDGLVADIFDEGLYDILDDYDRRGSRPLARVTYEKSSKYCEGKEAFVIYLDTERNGDWGMSTAYALMNDRVSYQLVTQICELMKLGYEIYWR